MEITGTETKCITPSPGHLLTQAANVKLIDRFFTEMIYLAINDTVDNYKEIPIEEANKIIKEQLNQRK